MTNKATNDDYTATEEKTARQRLTPTQKIARMQTEIARLRTQEQKRTRQMDTREKVVIGGAIIKAMRENEAFRWQVVALLQENVTRSIDREAIASWLAPTSTPQ